MNTVVAVVVTYNRVSMLQQCIEHLKMQSCSCDIIVVNNASTDGTTDWLNNCLSKEKNIYVYNLKKNTGGAGGFNAGMRIAAEKGYEFIWVMDDDCFPNPDALGKLLDADTILDHNYGWLSSVALWTDGAECKMNRQKLKKSFYEYSQYLKYGIVQAEQATFVSLFIRTVTVRQVGLPLTQFFIWGDDVEFTRRIAVRHKFPSFIAGQSQVMHAMQLNNGSSIATDDFSRIGRYNYAFRNENYLYRKEGWKGFLYYMGRCGNELIKVILYSKDHRMIRVGIIIKQFFSGLFFNPEVEYLKK